MVLAASFNLGILIAYIQNYEVYLNISPEKSISGHFLQLGAFNGVNIS